MSFVGLLTFDLFLMGGVFGGLGVGRLGVVVGGGREV